MPARCITDNVLHVGVQDWDRREFDELIPLPEGTSYNSYLVKGSERTALIDTVDPPFWPKLKDNILSSGIEQLDYVVSNHCEQDHSGSIPMVLEEFPECMVLTNSKNQGMLIEHLGIPAERIQVVGEDDVIDLGGLSLGFLMAPWVHWPETMFTYCPEEKTLFTCDFLGAHLACSSLFVPDWGHYSLGAKRYFAEIMMPFSHLIPKYIDRVRGVDVGFVCPSHGPIHDNVPRVLDAWEEWSSGPMKNAVVVIYVSMHGSVKLMTDHFVDALIDRGIEVHYFNLSETDLGDLAMSLVDSATVVAASSTVLAGPHPKVAYAVMIANALRPRTKFASVIASFGWGSKVIEQITGMLPNLKAEILDPVMVKGMPWEKDYVELDRLADDIASKHREAGLME